jgi:hypothetical protein
MDGSSYGKMSLGWLGWLIAWAIFSGVASAIVALWFAISWITNHISIT